MPVHIDGTQPVVFGAFYFHTGLRCGGGTGGILGVTGGWKVSFVAATVALDLNPKNCSISFPNLGLTNFDIFVIFDEN